MEPCLTLMYILRVQLLEEVQGTWCSRKIGDKILFEIENRRFYKYLTLSQIHFK